MVLDALLAKPEVNRHSLALAPPSWYVESPGFLAYTWTAMHVAASLLTYSVSLLCWVLSRKTDPPPSLASLCLQGQVLHWAAALGNRMQCLGTQSHQRQGWSV